VKKILVALLALNLVACAGEHEDLQTFVNTVNNDKRGNIPPLQQIKPYEPVPYTVEAKLDPFSDAKIEPETRVSSPNGPNYEERDKRNSIMEKYPLESMRMVGYLNINHQPMAAIRIEQGGGLVKQVKVGEYIGLDFGLVTKVTDQEVEVKEMIEDSDNEWTERINTLQLQAEEGGK
jgi:type IV pilus assembly protein PilP